MSKKAHYVNNTDFLNALVDYHERCSEAKKQNKLEPSIPNYIGECFMKIAEHLARKPNFVMYSFKEEMIGDAIENCILYFRNFDPNKSKNPFAYFTQIIYFAFLRRIAREKKQLYVKYKATEQCGILGEDALYEDENGNIKPFAMYDNISEFIHTFEETKKSKKKKKGITKGIENFIETNVQQLDEI
jgi:hypothetical protein